MNFKKFQQEALKTESKIARSTKLDMSFLWSIGMAVSAAGRLLDCYKKRVFYRDTLFLISDKWHQAITSLSAISDIISKNRSYVPQKRSAVDPRLLHAAISIATESLEIFELVHDAALGKRQLDLDKLKEEVADLEWGRAFLYDVMGYEESDIRRRLIAKLRARYGTKFSRQRAICRNVEKEQQAFKGE